MTWICSQCGERFSRYRPRCSADGQRVVEDLSGTVIGGRYRIHELIGVGGMDSTVWKAWQTGTERLVAVKVLPAPEEAAARRFARGARIAANLNHPNCTVVHDYGQAEDGKLFLVMEFLEGRVLQAALGADDKLPVPDVLHIAEQVLRALEHAHAQRAVHRDLKPDNLFLTRKNDDPLHVKILDFGIAKYVEEDPEALPDEATRVDDGGFENLVTEQRQVCGTPQYMAPEQVVGARIDGRTDLYSLGCVMFRMLTGRLPFDGKSRYELYQKHLSEPAPSLQQACPGQAFPDRLELILAKALAKRPADRFQDAREMRKALESLQPQARSTAPVTAAQPRATPPPRPLTRPVMTAADGAPTLLPGSNWTLSRPAVGAGGMPSSAPPPPLPGDVAPVRPRSQEASSLLPDTARRKSRPVSSADLAAIVPPAPSGPGSQMVRPVTPLPIPPRPLSIHVPASGSSPAVRARPATSLLNDAVLQHPVGRSMAASAAEFAQPIETEPNSAAAGGRAKPRWGVIAILAAAFLLGVGGVGLLMHALKASPPPAPAVASVEAGAGGSGAQEAAPAGGGGPAATAAAAAVVEVDGGALGQASAASDATDAAEVGAAAAEAPVAVAATEADVRVESVPMGARVFIATTEMGVTPMMVKLTQGAHEIRLEHPGFRPETVTLQIGEAELQAGLTKQVTLAAIPVAVVPTTTTPAAERTPQPQVKTNPIHPQPVAVDPTPRPVTPSPRVLEQPSEPKAVETAPVEVKPTEPKPVEVKPTEVKPKKPTVKLLGEDDEPSPGPRVRVLGE